MAIKFGRHRIDVHKEAIKRTDKAKAFVTSPTRRVANAERKQKKFSSRVF